MHFKLILAFINDELTDQVVAAARDSGATGATVINHARGEGINKKTTFFGLNLEVQVDVVLFVVEEHLARKILEKINHEAGFDTNSGAGMAIQLDIEDAVGIMHQMHELESVVKDKL